jgi:hypothetical protein
LDEEKRTQQSQAKEETLEKYFKEHVFWRWKILDETDIRVICNELGLDPNKDIGLIYKIHARYLRPPSIL